jgi:hypothetical protein
MVSSGGRKQLELVKPILPDALLGNIPNEGAGDPSVLRRLVRCRPFLTVSIDGSPFL